jgi:hypothetical protein
LANKSKQTLDISSRVDTKHPQVVHSGQLTRWLSNFANKYVYYNIYLPERQK